MLEYLYLPKMGFANFNGISSLIRKGQASCWLFAWFVQHGGHACGCKSHLKLITASEAKCNCMRGLFTTNRQ